MRKYVILVSVLVLVAAVAITLGVAGRGDAYPSGWNGGCGNCHAGGPGSANPLSPHNVAAHQSMISSGQCLNCHTSSPGDTPDISKCTNCHGGLTAIVNKPTHSTSGCLAAGCHGTTTTTAASTTTTTAGTTTTTAASTTTTAAGTTTTTAAGTTTTTTAGTTTTTAAATTTTTVPVTEPAFTG